MVDETTIIKHTINSKQIMIIMNNAPNEPKRENKTLKQHHEAITFRENTESTEFIIYMLWFVKSRCLAQIELLPCKVCTALYNRYHN